MKNITRMALVPGMEIAVDVHNHRNEIIVSAGTKVDHSVIRTLQLYAIMAVTIMEDIDYATTYFEKVRLSKGFIKFNEAYNRVMPIYKANMLNFVNNRVPILPELLMQLFDEIANQVTDRNKILDYLYNMLPSEDNMTHAHCLNSALIAGVFSPWLCLSPENTQTLILCAFFYDIGKLRLPDSLIWKPDKLTEIEFIKIKNHTLLGFELLRDMNLNPHIINATLMHHERCDGTGYPSKLNGQRIDMYAKLVAVIDCYEAMTSARMYRQSKHPFEVIASFEEMGFHKFDERLLRPLLLNIAQNMVGNKVLLSNDQEAEVVTINETRISRPVIKGQSGSLIDLSIHEALQIRGIR